MNPRLIIFAGIAACLAPGAIYSYGLFSKVLEASFNFTPLLMAIGFGLAIFMVGIGAVIGGALADRFGPRYVAVVGSVLWGVGNIAFGLTAPALGIVALYVAYGLVGGFGAGMVYISAIESVVKLFPRRRGLGSGLVTMGFGLGAFIYNNVASRISSITTLQTSAATYITARDAAGAAFKPFKADTYLLTNTQIGDLMHIFVMSGVVFAVFGAIVCYLLPASRVEVEAEAADVAPGRMLARPQFYILWAILLLNSLAGVIVIDNAQLIAQELIGGGADVVLGLFQMSDDVQNLFAWIILAIAVGQVFWGIVSDRLGRRTSFSLIFALQALAFIALAFTHVLWLAAALFALALFCSAGGFAMMPAYNSDYFGLRYIGANYGLNITAWGIAYLVGTPLMQGILGVTGSYTGTLEPTAILLVVAIVFPIISESVTERQIVPSTPVTA
jgi:MFS family permease